MHRRCTEEGEGEGEQEEGEGAKAASAARRRGGEGGVGDEGGGEEKGVRSNTIRVEDNKRRRTLHMTGGISSNSQMWSVIVSSVRVNTIEGVNRRPNRDPNREPIESQ
jgi:hypothetical protein